MGISILKELDKLSEIGPDSQFSSAFFLTYTLNLRFFEDLVLPRLERIGINHIGILCDRSAYAASLEDPVRAIECGQSYVVGTSPQVLARQHAKMIWLHGDYDHVFIGSHNLTMSGFNDQLEITAILSSREPSHIGALRGVYGAVTELVQGHHHLGRIWRRVEAPFPDDTPPSVFFLWNREQGLLDQLSETVGNVDQIEVVTPYLDADALLRLKQNLSAKTMVIDIPRHGTDSPLSDAVDRIPDLTARRIKSNARLHAKAYSLTRGSDHWLALGSANCTNLGLVKSVREGGNIEFLVLAPGASLADPDEGLEIIDDPSTFQEHTGRNWDEEGIAARMVEIDFAEYMGQFLTVHWSEAGFSLDSVTLRCMDESYPCDASPFVLKVDEPPTEITLEVTSNGKQGTSKAWVVHPERLQEYASQARYRRMRDAIASDNPIDHSNGIDAYFNQILRDLHAVVPPTGRSFSSSSKLDITGLREAVELIGFSPNIESVASASETLISGNADLDPLAALRGLVLRLATGVPPSSAQDEASVARFEAQRKRAKQRSVNRLIKHLNALCNPSEWHNPTQEAVVLSLRDTFEATALIWHDIVRTGGEVNTNSRLLEAFLRFLNACTSSEITKTVCSQPEVAGPIVLAVGVALGDADQSDQSRLRQAIQAITSDPREVFRVWRDIHADRANLLGVQAESTNRLAAWAQPVFHLFGELASHIMSRRQSRWGTLFEIHNIKDSGATVPPDLSSHAESLYREEPIWRRYQAYGLISFVTGPICGCGIALSMQKRRQLERGDPVPCDACHNIVMWKAT